MNIGYTNYENIVNKIKNRICNIMIMSEITQNKFYLTLLKIITYVRFSRPSLQKEFKIYLFIFHF